MPCRKGCLLSSSANVLVCKGSSRLHCSGRQIYSFCDAVTLEFICLHSLQSTLRMFTNELSGRSPRCQTPQRHRCHHTPSPSKSCHSKRKPTVLKYFANASCLTLAACKAPNALACSQSSVLEHQIYTSNIYYCLLYLWCWQPVILILPFLHASCSLLF